MEFRLVDRATLAPSRCFFCQAGDGPMIDTGLRGRLPYGAVYICVNRCLSDLVSAGGGLTGPEASHLLKASGEQLREIAALRSELEPLRRLQRALDEAREQVPA